MPPAGPGGFNPGSVLRMSILNRRNAVVGWLVTKVAKSVVKRKAAKAAPSAKTGGAAAGALAAVTGALLFWKKRAGSGSDDAE